MTKTIRTFFDGRVDEWDRLRYQDETYTSRARVALSFLMRAPRGRYLLDLGCGTGRQSMAMLQHGDRVVSADFSEQMARATLERIRSVQPGAASAVVVADASHPPFRAGSFDAVLALGLIGFIRDRTTLMAELRSLITPGGDLVCDSGVPEREVLFQAASKVLDAPVEAVLRVYRLLTGRTATSKPRGWYFQNFIKHSPPEFERLLRSAGFQPVRAGGAGFGELELQGRPLLPWRLRNWISRQLSRASVRRGGAFLARHALTYVVLSRRTADAASANTRKPQSTKTPAHASSVRR